MKKILQVLLRTMNWLAPFASVVAIITLPAQAVKAPLGSLIFWLYLVLAFAGMGSLLFMMLGWIQMDWRLRCYETLTNHEVFRDEQQLVAKPKMLMVLIAAIVNPLVENGIADGVILGLLELVVALAAVANLICLVVAGGFYLYLKIYVERRKETYVTYEYALPLSDDTRQYCRDVCQISQLKKTLETHQLAKWLCEAIFQVRVTKVSRTDRSASEDPTSRH